MPTHLPIRILVLLFFLSFSSSRDHVHKKHVKQVSREKFQGGSNDQYLLANTFDDDEIFVSPDELIEDNPRINFPDDQGNYSGDGESGGDDESDGNENSKSNDKKESGAGMPPRHPLNSAPTLTPFTIEEKYGGCEIDQFQCLNGQCIDSSARCDQHFDCGDGSDEIACGK